MGVKKFDSLGHSPSFDRGSLSERALAGNECPMRPMKTACSSVSGAPVLLESAWEIDLTACIVPGIREGATLLEAYR